MKVFGIRISAALAIAMVANYFLGSYAEASGFRQRGVNIQSTRKVFNTRSVTHVQTLRQNRVFLPPQKVFQRNIVNNVNKTYVNNVPGVLPSPAPVVKYAAPPVTRQRILPAPVPAPIPSYGNGCIGYGGGCVGNNAGFNYGCYGGSCYGGIPQQPIYREPEPTPAPPAYNNCPDCEPTMNVSYNPGFSVSGGVYYNPGFAPAPGCYYAPPGNVFFNPGFAPQPYGNVGFGVNYGVYGGGNFFRGRTHFRQGGIFRNRTVIRGRFSY